MFIRMRDSHTRSLAKAVSWRMLGSVDTLVLSFIFTGSIKLAGSIASTEMITKVALYYLHERAWSQIGFRQKADDAGGADKAAGVAAPPQ
jgi:uncharacterized membrane protein